MRRWASWGLLVVYKGGRREEGGGYEGFEVVLGGGLEDEGAGESMGGGVSWFCGQGGREGGSLFKECAG